jgi:DNA invertase Pin-like site-specific DNA recombinase
MAHILGYARVSTDDQDLTGQKRRLEAAGAFRVFEDVISGKTFTRPGLTSLLDHLRPGDTLAVVRLDRLGRSLRELLEVIETLKQRGVALLSLEEKLDTSSAAGELVFHVFGAIAQFERRLIAERTRDGIANARAKGRRPGRPPLIRTSGTPRSCWCRVACRRRRRPGRSAWGGPRSIGNSGGTRVRDPGAAEGVSPRQGSPEGSQGGPPRGSMSHEVTLGPDPLPLPAGWTFPAEAWPQTFREHRS